MFTFHPGRIKKILLLKYKRLYKIVKISIFSNFPPLNIKSKSNYKLCLTNGILKNW